MAEWLKTQIICPNVIDKQVTCVQISQTSKCITSIPYKTYFVFILVFFFILYKTYFVFILVFSSPEPMAPYGSLHFLPHWPPLGLYNYTQRQ